MVKVKFATPGEYLEAASAAGSKTYTLAGDFFTYNDRGEQYWSGFYTSRPFLKTAIRRLQMHLRSEHFLFSQCSTLQRHKLGIVCFLFYRAAEILYSLMTPLRSDDESPKERKSRDKWLTEIWNELVSARETSALMQHHDAITGTATKQVVSNYLNRWASVLPLFTHSFILLSSNQWYFSSVHRSDRGLEKIIGKLTAFLLNDKSSVSSLPDFEAVSIVCMIQFEWLIHHKKCITIWKLWYPKEIVYRAGAV